MAGFLDKNTQIVDMHLTMEGKRLLANGNLQFVYFALFDDEVDYDPYVGQSGSMTFAQLSGTKQDYLEASLVREAVSGYRLGANSSGSDFTNVRYPLFTMKQGSSVLPRLSSSDAPLVPSTLEVKQQKRRETYVSSDKNGNVVQQLGSFDRGYDRFGSQVAKFDMTLLPLDAAQDPQHQQGIRLRVFVTGSEGLVEVHERRSSENDLCFSNDFVLHVVDLPEAKHRG